MKTLLLATFLLSGLCAKSQTDSLLEVTKDKFTNKTNSKNKNIILIKSENRGDASVHLMKKDGIGVTISFIAQSRDFGCTDDSGLIYFLATDNSKIEAKNNTDFNCSGLSTIFLSAMMGGKKIKNFIKEKQLKSVRLQSRSTYIDYEINDEQAKYIQQVMIALDK